MDEKNMIVLEERKIKALESIAKSLSALSEDVKASKELKIEIEQNLLGFEKSLTSLKEDPFGLAINRGALK